MVGTCAGRSPLSDAFIAPKSNGPDIHNKRGRGTMGSAPGLVPNDLQRLGRDHRRFCVLQHRHCCGACPRLSGTPFKGRQCIGRQRGPPSNPPLECPTTAIVTLSNAINPKVSVPPLRRKSQYDSRVNEVAKRKSTFLSVDN